MIKTKSIVLGLVAMMSYAVIAGSPAPQKALAAEPTIPLSVKSYVPDQYDFHDYWGGIGDIEPEFGDGVTTFAHITGYVPFKGDAIRMRTSFMLLSANSIENGGDGVDSWLTYSFSAQPGGSADNSFPYYAGGASGYFLHITNFSSTAVPNVVEMQFVKSVDGVFSNVVPNFFVDNIVTNGGVLANDPIVFDLELVKTEGFYSLTFTNVETETVIKKIENIELDDALFMNSLGQTFFSTALYEGAGCDGNHWEHRGLKIHSYDAYTYDATDAVITLDNETFEYDGLSHRPNVSVTVNDVALVKDVDFYTEGTSIAEIGEGKVQVYFINNFAGNPMVEKTFNVVAIDASEAVVTLEEDEFTFTGDAIEPTVTSVKLGETTLVDGVDYDVTYTNNTQVGTGTVVVTFKGVYSGSVETTFTIIAVQTSEEPVSEEPVSEPTSEDDEPSTGCFGSIAATASMSVALLGIAVFLTLKKRKLS